MRTQFFWQIIFFLIFKVLSQSPNSSNKMTLGKEVEGEINVDDGVEYYQLQIPSSHSKASFLLFTVHQNDKDIKDGDEIFSDPDVYVSKTNQFPSSPKNSEWYSERYGSDILSISSNDVKSNDVFYVGLYCQFKCKYKLLAYLSDEVEIKVGTAYNIRIPKGRSINYKLTVSQPFKELDIIASSPSLSPFKIFVHQNNPSSQNTYKILPSWSSGYMVSIEKDSKEYCTNCSYRILVQSSQDSEARLQLFSYFQDGITTLSSGKAIYDSIKDNRKRCYKFPITSNDKKTGENVVISTTFFSGYSTLVFGGWKDISGLEFSSFPSTSKNVHYINSEGVFLLTKKEYDEFDKEAGSNPNRNDDFWLCLFSRQKSSYIINMYYLSDAEDNQSYNFIVPNIEVEGYLQKDQTTSYRILEFSQESTLTITLDQVLGYTPLYSHFCKEEKCRYNKAKIIELSEKGELLYGKQSFSGYDIEITNNNNKCHQGTVEERFNCSTMIIVTCIDTDFCSFRLRVKNEASAVKMIPKKTYYNILPASQENKYEVIITDEKTKSLVIVLNSVSGDAELFVYRTKFTDPTKKELIGISVNNDYIPDVVRITPKGLNDDNILGTYIIRVTAKSFSTYNLYYYTTFERKGEVDPTEVTIQLIDGYLVTDYFPNDIDYKIYSYTPVPGSKKENIKFVLNKLNIPYSFKIFKGNLAKLKYTKEEGITGFDFESDFHNEFLLSPQNPKYSITDTYYIVVVKNFVRIEETELTKSSVGSYYIGAAIESKPFILYEGIQFESCLSTKNKNNIYYYNHFNISLDFELGINVISGAVNVYVDTNQFTIEKITKIKEKIKEGNAANILGYAQSIDDYHSLIVPSKFFLNKCAGRDDYSKSEASETIMRNLDGSPERRLLCSVYIYVENALTDSESQYAIVPHTSMQKGDILLPGVTKVDVVKKGEAHHYVIEEMRKRKGSFISLTFYSGFGELYLYIPKKPLKQKDMKFPDKTFYTYKGEGSYMGRTIQIPSSVFESLTENNPKIQLLISVEGTDSSYLYSNSSSTESKIEYILSYSSEPKRIIQNIPYYSSILAGEYHYFQFYFDEDINNIYVSLSNMNGDADLFMSYGDSFPTPRKSDFNSITLGHDFIDINIENQFFKDKGLKTLGGYYTLLVYGYTNTTYTLYVSTHDTRVFPLYDNSPMKCNCEKGDSCYFRYDSFYEHRDNFTSNYEVIFTSSFVYGAGMMYTKLYDKFDFTNRKGIYKDFPSDTDHDQCNRDSSQRNYLKVSINKKNNPKFTDDSVLMMTFKCFERTSVEINTATLFNDAFSYLSENRENIFFLRKGENKPKTLVFYNYDSRPLAFEIHGYVGEGKIVAYINETAFGAGPNATFEYHHISDALIRARNSFFLPQTKDYFNIIESNEKTREKTIKFRVIPYEDFGFYIKLTYSRKWNKLPISKAKEYQLEGGEFIGYFDLLGEYDDVEVTVTINGNPSRKKGFLYAKINTIDKSPLSPQTYSENGTFSYIIPSDNNHDFKAESDDIIGGMSLKINEVGKINSERGKIKRVLLKVEVKDRERTVPDSEDDPSVVGEIDEEDTNDSETRVTIIVIPCTNNYKRVDAYPLVYYLSDYTKHSSNYESQKDVKIYQLDKMEKEDDIMIIELSSCSGEYDFNITSGLTLYNTSVPETAAKVKKVEYFFTSSNGRQTLTIPKLKDNHIYLTVWEKKSVECALGKKCSKNLKYLLRYYTTKQSQFEYNAANTTLDYTKLGIKGIKILIPTLKKRDIFGNERDSEKMIYNVLISENKEDYKNMESICYLTQMKNKQISDDKEKERIKSYKVKLKKGKEDEVVIKKLGGKKYYINILAENKETKELIAFKPIYVNNTPTFETWIVIIANYLIYVVIAMLVIYGLVMLFNFLKDKLRILRGGYAPQVNESTSIPVPSTTELSTVRGQEQVDDSDTKYSNIKI